jgi:hypothetical protein
MRGGLALAFSLLAVASPTAARPNAVSLDRGFLGYTVNARLAGRSVRLIVDTGSSDVVIDRRRRDLDTQATFHGKGDDGVHTVGITARSAVPVQIGSFRTTVSRVVFLDWDASSSRTYHVDGVLSPERLTTTSAVLFDLVHRRLRFFATTSEMLEWIRERRGTARRLPVRDGEGRPLIPARAGSRGIVWVGIDTGSAQTSFPPGYFDGLTPIRRASHVGASGVGRTDAVYGTQIVVVGGIPTRLHRVMTEPVPAVGTDVLAGYAIALPRGRLDHLWLVRTL